MTVTWVLLSEAKYIEPVMRRIIPRVDLPIEYSLGDQAGGTSGSVFMLCQGNEEQIRLLSSHNSRIKKLAYSNRRWYAEQAHPLIKWRASLSDDGRQLLALPTRLGGMGITIAHEIAETEYKNPRQLTDITTKD